MQDDILDRSDIADIELAGSGNTAIEWAREHSPLVDGYLRERLSDGALDGKVDVLSSGALANIAGGLGHPIEIMDLSFAVQGVGCHELPAVATNPACMSSAPKLSREIAAAKLQSCGIALDRLTMHNSTPCPSMTT